MSVNAVLRGAPRRPRVRLPLPVYIILTIGLATLIDLFCFPVYNVIGVKRARLACPTCLNCAAEAVPISGTSVGAAEPIGRYASLMKEGLEIKAKLVLEGVEMNECTAERRGKERRRGKGRWASLSIKGCFR